MENLKSRDKIIFNANAVGRLGGQSMVQDCQELKVKILDQSNKEIMLEIKQSQKSIQDISQEVDAQKVSHSELKLSSKKGIESLTNAYASMKTDHAEKTKEVEKLANSYVSLKMDHEEKTKEVEKLAKSYVGLKTKHEILAKSHVTLKTVHDEKTKEIDKLKANQEDVIPWNVRGQINRKLETWKKDDQMFVETRAAKCVLEYLKTESCVTVTGSSGMGKTFTVRHVALQVAGDGYDIIPVTSPKDIEKYYNPNKKTLFVIDNLCGTYTLNQTVLDKWKSLSGTITDILEDKVTKKKIIASCRSQVYQDELFKTLSLFTSCECNLMSKELRLLYTERQSLAELYLKTEALKVREYLNLYDCFPLLCKLYSENQNFDVTDFFKNPCSVYEAEVSKLWTERAYGKYCALALCVMFNNHIKEEWLTEDINKDMRTVIENICEACKLQRGTSRLIIRDELESLTHTFTRKDTEIRGKYWLPSIQGKIDDTKLNDELGTFYCTIHDRLFDYLVSYFGKVMIPTMIMNGDRKLILDRFVFEKEDDSDQFTVIVPKKYQQMHLQRMINYWDKGHVSHVFNNVNMKKQKFRDIFMKLLTSLEPSFQKKLVEMCDVTYKTTDKSYERRHPWENYASTSPLIFCCLVGDIDMVQWFCVHGSDVNHCNNEGDTPLHMACREGHTEVVNALINSSKANVNKCKNRGESSLYIACYKGFTEIVSKLIDNNADVNQCAELGKSPLFVACRGGYSEIVIKLLDNKADVNQCTSTLESPLYIACKGGKGEIVNLLIHNEADINQSTNEGKSPLYIACAGGHNEVVTLLLHNDANVNQCTHKSESPLFAACTILNKLDIESNFEINNDTDTSQYNENGTHRKLQVCSGIKYRCANIVKLLMNAGADYTLCNREEKSPSDLF